MLRLAFIGLVGYLTATQQLPEAAIGSVPVELLAALLITLLLLPTIKRLLE